jgi:hypothetical protein
MNFTGFMIGSIVPVICLGLGTVLRSKHRRGREYF